MELVSNITCCFTGHRPQNLSWGFNEEDERCVELKKRIKVEIENAIIKGYSIFISGMALGFDIMCAEAVVDLKKKYSHISIFGALPCKDQDRFWSSRDKKRYNDLIEQLDDKKYINSSYIGAKCMIERNKFMIDNSSLVIALYNGKKGGTEQTLNYAKKKGLQMVVLSSN